MNKQNQLPVSKAQKEKLEKNRAPEFEVKEQTKKVISQRMRAIKDLAKK